MAVKVNGTKGNDSFSIMSGDYVINAGDGNDSILVSGGVNTITGGKGTNTVTLWDISQLLNPGIEGAGFGNNTINLTKNENLIIDCKDYSDFKANNSSFVRRNSFSSFKSMSTGTPSANVTHGTYDT